MHEIEDEAGELVLTDCPMWLAGCRGQYAVGIGSPARVPGIVLKALRDGLGCRGRGTAFVLNMHEIADKALVVDNEIRHS